MQVSNMTGYLPLFLTPLYWFYGLTQGGNKALFDQVLDLVQ